MTTIVTRASKGSALTWTEGDNNITNLNNDKIELTDLSITTTTNTDGGSLSYNNTTGVFTFAPGGMNSYIRAKASENISKGQVVMFSGVQGDHILVELADITAVGFIPEWIVGVAGETLATNDFGNIVTFGEVRDIDTATDYNEGDILYVSPTTPGALTSTEPTAPNFKITVAAVTKEDATEGIILVRPQVRPKLSNLSDVDVSGITDGQTLIWDNANSKFIAGSGGGSGLSNVVDDTTPQLGGNLDVNGNAIVSDSNGNIRLEPNGSGNIQLTPTSGKIILGALDWPTSMGSNGQFLMTDGASGTSWTTVTSGIASVSADTNPSLGGNLDVAGYSIVSTSNGNITVAPNGTGKSIVNNINYSETPYSLGSTDSPSIDVTNGNVQSVTITSGLSLPAFTGAASGQSVTLLVTGSGTATGTGAYKFAGGATTLTSYSVVSIFYDGTTYWASINTDFQ